MYCTTQEVRAMLKDDTINALLGDRYIEEETERETRFEALIHAAIADACAEIDGYLAKQYAVPLARVPGVVGKFAKDIAVYNLFSRIGIDEQGESKTYLNRYNAAIQFFTLVAADKVSIGASGSGPTGQSIGEFSVTSSPRLFSREQLGGM